MKLNYKYCIIIKAKYNILTIFVVIFGFIGLSCEVKAQLSGEIINPEVFKDTLDYGICIIGDTIQSTFTIRNTGSKTLKIGPVRPSFSIEETGGIGHENDHEEFKPNFSPPILIHITPGMSFELKVRFEPLKDTNNYQMGVKYARLTIGLYDSLLSLPPENLDDYVTSIDVILTARKVRRYIDGFVNSYNFDSVYVNPQNPIEFKWKVANGSKRYLQIDSQNIVWKTLPLTPPEFEIEKKSLPIPMPSGSNPIDWSIIYSPRNRGEDKAVLLAGYHLSDTLVFTYLDINGFGVEQDLIAVSSSASYTKDTIDIGRVWVNQSKEVWVSFGNNGNMNFGASKQYIYDGLAGDFPSEFFSITRPINENRNFFPTQGDTFKIQFTPTRKGKFVARYIVESNIANRKIRGVPESALSEIFYLKGEGIEPQLIPEFDTLNFGNVVWHPDCSQSRTFTLRLRNQGNTDLQIFDILYEPPFSIGYFKEPFSFIKALSVDSIKVVFEPFIQEYYQSDLIFITNGNPPQDEIKVILIATKSDPDYVKLSIAKDIKVKPGNNLTVPLFVDAGLIQKARTFESELTYNKTILRYAGYDILGTAAENTDANDIVISELNGGGKLNIYLETPTKGTFFLPREILLRLNFKTYIGDDISTPLAFIEPLFGDGFCNKVLLPLDTNGIVTLDSICGLPNLLLPQGYGSFLIGEIAPNPVSGKATIYYELKYKIPIEIILFNELGNPVKTLLNEIQDPGIYELSFSMEDIPNGIFYLQFKSGIFSTYRRIIRLR